MRQATTDGRANTYMKMFPFTVSIVFFRFYIPTVTRFADNFIVYESSKGMWCDGGFVYLVKRRRFLVIVQKT